MHDMAAKEQHFSLHRHNDRLSRALGLKGHCCVGLCGAYCKSFFESGSSQEHFAHLRDLLQALSEDGDEDDEDEDVDEEAEAVEQRTDITEPASTAADVELPDVAPQVDPGGAAGDGGFVHLQSQNSKGTRGPRHCARAGVVVVTTGLQPHDLHSHNSFKERLLEEIPWFLHIEQRREVQEPRSRLDHTASNRGGGSNSAGGTSRRASVESRRGTAPSSSAHRSTSRHNINSRGPTPSGRVAANTKNASSLSPLKSRLGGTTTPGPPSSFSFHSPYTSGRLSKKQRSLVDTVVMLQRMQFVHLGVRNFFALTSDRGRSLFIEASSRARASKAGGGAHEGQHLGTIGNAAAGKTTTSGGEVLEKSRMRSWSERLADELHMDAPPPLPDSSPSTRDQSGSGGIKADSLAKRKTGARGGGLLTKSASVAAFHKVAQKKPGVAAFSEDIPRRARAETVVVAQHSQEMSMTSAAKAYENLDKEMDTRWVELLSKAVSERPPPVSPETAGHAMRVHLMKPPTAAGAAAISTGGAAPAVTVGLPHERQELSKVFQAIVETAVDWSSAGKTSPSSPTSPHKSPAACSSLTRKWFVRVSFFRHSDAGEQLGAHQMCFTMSLKAKGDADEPMKGSTRWDLVLYDPNREPEMFTKTLPSSSTSTGGCVIATSGAVVAELLDFFVDRSVSTRHAKRTKSLVFSFSVWRGQSSGGTGSGGPTTTKPQRNFADELLARFARIREESLRGTKTLLGVFKDQALVERLIRAVGGRAATTGGQKPDAETSAGYGFYRALRDAEYPGLPGYRRLLARALKQQIGALVSFLADRENWIYSAALKNTQGTFDDHESFESYVREFAQTEGGISLWSAGASSGTTSMSTSTTSTCAGSLLERYAKLAEDHARRAQHEHDSQDSSAAAPLTYGRLFREKEPGGMRVRLLEQNPERCGVFFFDEPLLVLKRWSRDKKVFPQVMDAYY